MQCIIVPMKTMLKKKLEVMQNINHFNIVKCMKYINAPYIQPFGTHSVAVLEHDKSFCFNKVKY